MEFNWTSSHCVDPIAESSKIKSWNTRHSVESILMKRYIWSRNEVQCSMARRKSILFMSKIIETRDGGIGETAIKPKTSQTLTASTIFSQKLKRSTNIVYRENCVTGATHSHERKSARRLNLNSTIIKPNETKGKTLKACCYRQIFQPLLLLQFDTLFLRDLAKNAVCRIFKMDDDCLCIVLLAKFEQY